MTVQDLMRHTSGLTYGSRGTSLVNQAYIDAKIGDRELHATRRSSRNSRSCRCRFSPGDRWEYGVVVDVLGRLVEVCRGKKLGTFSASAFCSRSA